MSQSVWNQRYLSGRLLWDIGEVSPAIQQLVDTHLQPPANVVVIGCGQGWEVQFLLERGFDVTALDIAPAALDLLARRVGQHTKLTMKVADVIDLPNELINGFDIALEHNCLCAMLPVHWYQYVNSVYRMLHSDGLYVGSLLNFDSRTDSHPPFGITDSQTLQLLGSCFHVLHLTRSTETFPPARIPLMNGVSRVPQLEFIACKIS